MTSEAAPDARLRAGAVAGFALLVAAVVGNAWVSRGLTAAPGAGDGLGLDVGQALGATLTGALGLTLTWLRPRNPIGWLIMASGLALAVCDLGQNYGARALLLPEEHLPLGELALSLSAPLWIAALLLPVTLVLVRYPSGRLTGRWPRRFQRLLIAAFALVYVGYAASPQSVTDEVPAARPHLLLPEAVAGGVLAAGGLLLLVGLLAVLGDALRRAVRADSRERAALLWLLVTAVIAVLVVWFGPTGNIGSIAFSAVLGAVALGVLRYQALGIEVVVRRALLYAVLTGLVLVAFVGITAGLARLVPTGPMPQVIAAVLIAVGLTPARERVQRLVDRLLYGDRDAAGALRRLGSSVGSAPAEGLLLAVLANLTEALRIDGAALLDATGHEVARWGTPGSGVRLPLAFAGADLGVLVVGARPGEAGLGRTDRQLLDTISPLIAAVVHAQRLAHEVRAERNRVVDATLAERARLRHDLHDGLGPALTGIGLGLEALQGGPAGADPRAAELLSRIRVEVASSLDEIRRIIDDLRPGALSAGDLGAALEQRAVAAEHSGMRVRVLLPDPLPDLPVEVETALFRIADEALHNVVRHAGARTCTVELRTGSGSVELVVADDGIGIGAEARDGGVGLGSMRERAARVGGRLVLEPAAPGTVVRAVLPISVPATEGAGARGE
jgi:two-component system NarL family sensor kinase